MDFSVIAAAVSSGISNGVRVGKTSIQGLNRAVFEHGGQKIIAIQQNPNTGSKWAQLAKKGHDVVQFKEGKRYIGVAVDGKYQAYPDRQAGS